MNRSQKLAVVVSALGLAGHGCAWAQAVVRTPVAVDHPLIGTWRVDVPSLNCFEVYEIRPDGTTRVTSAKEIGESEFQISGQPSAKGFYKWVDKVIKNNGQPDCSGNSVPAGDVATNFVLLRADGDQFLMCEEESTKSCLGPFVRLKGT